MQKKSLLDVLLLPKAAYQRLTDKRFTLYAGLILIGIIDIVFGLLSRYGEMFKGKSQDVLMINILIMVLFIILLGLIDVVFFSLPVFDFLKLLKKPSGMKLEQNLLIKLMKVYIMVHFLVIPFNALVYFLFRDGAGVQNYPEILVLLAAVYLYLIMPVWFSAAITRGIGAVFNLEPIFKRLLFIAVFSWNFLLGYALEYITNNWIFVLFREPPKNFGMEAK